MIGWVCGGGTFAGSTLPLCIPEAHSMVFIYHMDLFLQTFWPEIYTTNTGVFGQPDHGIKNLVFECIATGQTPTFLQQTPVTVSYQLKKKKKNLCLNVLPPCSPLAVGEMPDLMPVKKWDSSLWLISVGWLCLDFSVGISLTAKKSEWASAPLCLSSALFTNENHC